MKEIVEKHQNKGLTELVHVDSFLSYIEGEAVLQQMIVTSVDQSVLGGSSTRIELQTKVPYSLIGCDFCVAVQCYDYLLWVNTLLVLIVS